MFVQSNNLAHKKWRLLARLVTLILIGTSVYLAIASLPNMLTSETYICTQEPCGYETIFPSELAPLAQFGLSARLYLLYRYWTEIPVLFAFLAVSILIFLRRSDESIGLITSIFLSVFPVTLWTAQVIENLTAWAIPLALYQAIGGVSFLILLYAFPTGIFFPRWTLGLSLLALVLMTVSQILSGIAPDIVEQPVPNFIFGTLWTGIYFVLMIIAFGAQFFRYWRISSPLQRQQTKWVSVAVIMMPVFDLLIRGLLTQLLPFASQPGPERVIFYMITIPLLRSIPFMMVPIAFAFAIFRYRLWDIDMLIRRTLIYSTLTVLMATIYLVGVVSVQRLVTILSGQEQSTIFTVLSTLALVVLFSPLRKRVQVFIDRRFYRRKYDAEKALAEFASVVRNQNDLEEVSGRLISTVQQTLQPSRVSLSLRQAQSRAERSISVERKG